ncbi:Predicted ATPase [Prauserella marina]|uniref:Predicted ATPase n=1 Tax=Prauserella marina TaxID=530584 RepID=A0A1G6QLU5_9PSEU|nr:BTAD domain-containing putative transcriptional regulator [Prauserella marina]PWV78759.1 putative ATPase [Prauserella marina]SDC92994.1 Predicted ATPase [Prauserella marina]
MRIEVLGPVRLSTGEGVPVEVAERQLRLLLASLVVAGGEPVSADALIDRLWEGRLPANPAKVLRAKLSRLRSVLDKARPGARELLTHTPAGYRLALSPDTVDAVRFRDAVERSRGAGTPAQRVEVLRDALESWRGEPYGDAVDEIWLAPSVSELRELRAGARESLSEALLDNGEPEQALGVANGVGESHPARERSAAAVMLALYQLGRQREALETFEKLRHHLADELGVDPSPQVRELHGRILRQDPSLVSKPAAEPVPARKARTNIPAETTPLIGRRSESRQIAELLAEARLVTLTGIGGVGKTKLALHVAREQAPRFERGGWFIDLTELAATPEGPRSGERVAASVIAALDLPEPGSPTGNGERVREAIGARPVLLVLDNCEHVIAEVAAFVGELLREAPAARVLATSREPMGLPEEQRFNVATLSTEPGEDGEAGEAVEFFAARAKAGDPDFAIDAETAEAITELCRRLDGLPLALELAASRIRGLSVPDLLERLSERLSILRRPGHAVPRRQQTLRGMIDWSWSLLDEKEQAVLRRLAVHPGSVGLAAAEAICADDPGTGALVDQSEVVDVLIGLVDRSMVTTVTSPAGVRYGLLESIATYAEEKLDAAGERTRVVRRHAEYYLRFAWQADAGLRGVEHRRWLTRFEAERTQLRNAFDEAVRRGEGDNAVALAVATFWHQWMTGRHGHLLGDLVSAMDLPGSRGDEYAAAATYAVCLSLDTEPGREVHRVDEALALFSGERGVRARVQWFAGSSLLSTGIREDGERHVDEAIGELEAAGLHWDAAVAASQRDWFVVSNWGEPPRGLSGGRDPEAVWRELGGGYGLAQVLAVEYQKSEVDGDHVGAAGVVERALEVCLDLELWAEASWWYVAAAITALRSGDLAHATTCLGNARGLAADVAYEYGLDFAAFAESMIARYHGDFPRARSLLDHWILRGATAVQEPIMLFEDGFLAVWESRIEHAEKVLLSLRSLYSAPRRASSPLVEARLLELAAAVSALRADREAAVELLGTAEAVRERAGVPASAPDIRDADRVRSLVDAQH